MKMTQSSRDKSAFIIRRLVETHIAYHKDWGKNPPNEKKHSLFDCILFYFSTYCLATALKSQLFS